MSKSKEDIEKALRFWDKVFWRSVIGFFVAGIAMVISIRVSEGISGTFGRVTWVFFGVMVACDILVVVAYIRDEQLKKKR